MPATMEVLYRDTPCLQTGWVYGDLKIAEIIAGSKKNGIVVDFSKLRQQRLESAQLHATAIAAATLARHPFTYLTLPIIAFPQITFALSLPEVRFPKQSIAAALNVTSHFSLAFAVALTLLFAGPIAILETQSLVTRASQTIGQYTQTETQSIAEIRPTTTPSPSPEVTSPQDIFSVKIPELGIESTITPNVNAANPSSYRDALKNGIAHAAGSGLPDQLDVSQTVYLFAHSTDEQWNIARYNAEFYALKDAQEGQKITVRFWGKDYIYQITEKHIVAANDTSWLEPQFNETRLVLQTCYPPGTAWKRLLVVATPITEVE